MHRARSKTVNGAGGVALLVRKDVKFCNDNTFDSLHLETCAINIFIENKEILIMSYYNPPNVQLSSTLFNEIIKQKSSVILLGDLNAKTTSLNCKENNPNGSILENVLCDHNLICLYNPNHTFYNFNGKTSEILDYCITTTNKFDKFEVLIDNDMTSDHVPFLVKFNYDFNKTANGECKKNKNTENTQFSEVFNFIKADLDHFKQELPTEIPEEIENNVDELNAFIVYNLIEASKKAIPTIKPKEYIKSLPRYILQLIETRKKFRKLKRKNKDFKEYATRYNFLTKLIRNEIEEINNNKFYLILVKIY